MQQKIGLYPSSDQKSDMAAASCKSFPCLGIRESVSVKHDHYYDPKAGGFLETRSKTLRKICLPNNESQKQVAPQIQLEKWNQKEFWKKKTFVKQPTKKC